MQTTYDMCIELDGKANEHGGVARAMALRLFKRLLTLTLAVPENWL